MIQFDYKKTNIYLSISKNNTFFDINFILFDLLSTITISFEKHKGFSGKAIAKDMEAIRFVMRRNMLKEIDLKLWQISTMSVIRFSERCLKIHRRFCRPVSYAVADYACERTVNFHR